MLEPETPLLRLVEGRSLPASAGRPTQLEVDDEMVELIEGWAANSATHGELRAWKVLMATSLWRHINGRVPRQS